MAKEAIPAAQPAPAPQAEAPKESFSMKKVLAIGIPVVIAQVVLIYFVFVKFIAPGMTPAAHSGPEPQTVAEAEPAQVLVIKDLIINPAGTNGTRFLLTTIGLEVPAAEIKTELEQKEVQTRDVLNTILTSKGLDELTMPQFKETLRREILEKVNANLKSGKISNVYFSKFIIQ